MVHHTRLDTAAAPAGLMRAALAEAHRWTTHRTAFQRRLIDQPLMRAVLADLALDWEGRDRARLPHRPRLRRARRTRLRPGRRGARQVPQQQALPPRDVTEAMEAMGGMGYVEDTALPLLYREAPLNGIWEGSGNVICLDILRTLAREPEAGRARRRTRRRQGRLPRLRHGARAPPHPLAGAARGGRGAVVRRTHGAPPRGLGAPPRGAARGGRRLRRHAPRGRPRPHTAGAVSGLDTAAILARL
jgi:putative acyl-CoA dehydrogenase